MKTARISLAVVAGLLLAFGYAAGSGHDRMSQLKIIIGLMFGTFMTFNLIRHPEQLTKLRLYLVAILLLVLVVYQVLTDPPMEALITVVISSAFMGVMIALASLPADASSTSTAEAEPSAPAAKD
ncbi:MAG: hypothetical protein EOP83_05040 [Verrucomicrobiaceae bacterium]|nr:MAG: hypothetical protein EOP83_05040 [Verrucomicrobiaceae bacterium]